MPEIPKFFLSTTLGLSLFAGAAFAQGPVPRLKAPIRVNLLQQNPETKQSKVLAERMSAQDSLRLPNDSGGGNFLGEDQLPDFSKGDIVEDDVFDMQKKEDFLNPEFLKPIDGADSFRNEQLEALRGELELEGEEQDLSEVDMRLQKERREFMREISGYEDPDYWETKAKLAEPNRGPKTLNSKNDNGREEPVDRTNRAATNLNIRDTEQAEEPWGSNPGIGQPGNAKADRKAFSNANTGSLIDGLISGNKDRLSMLDSINKKYGTYNSSDRANRDTNENRRPRMRPAFVENDDGGVGWRSDLRPANRDRRLDSLAPARERDNMGSSRLLAGFTSGSDASSGSRSGLPRLPGTSLSTSGSDSSVATLRIGGGSKSTNTRSALPGSKPSRSGSRGFDMGSGLGSSFDSGPIKSPFKF